MILIQPQNSRIDEYNLLRRTEGLGYELLELSFPAVMDSPMLAEQLSEYRSRVVFSLHGAFLDINIASKDPRLQAVSQKRSRQSCEMAQKLGASCVVFHTGFFPYLNDTAYLKDWAAECGAFYSGLQKEYGVKIFIENCMDRSPEALKLLMESAPELSICLDIGHINYGPTPFDEWFSALSPSIGYLHFSDNNGIYDDHLPLGKGNISWKKLSKLCRALGRDLPITLEVGGPDGISQSLDYLRQNNLYPFPE